jgi:hypothetical protein
MAYEVAVTASPTESLGNYKGGQCGVLTSDMSQIYSERLKLDDPDEHVILPDAISKEPLGPAVRQDDANGVLSLRHHAEPRTTRAAFLSLGTIDLASIAHAPREILRGADR